MAYVTITTSWQSLAALAAADGDSSITDGAAYYGQNHGAADIFVMKSSSAPTDTDARGLRLNRDDTFSAEADDDALYARTESGTASVYLWG